MKCVIKQHIFSFSSLFLLESSNILCIFFSLTCRRLSYSGISRWDRKRLSRRMKPSPSTPSEELSSRLCTSELFEKTHKFVRGESCYFMDLRPRGAAAGVTSKSGTAFVV